MGPKLASMTKTAPPVLSQALPEGVALRRSLRPGDVGAIVELHGRLYPPDYGVDGRLEAHIARHLAEAVGRGWPAEREGVWLLDTEEGLCGCIAFTDEGDGVACLRWVLLHPDLRGTGLGRALVAAVIGEVRGHGYRQLVLETFSDLTRAASIYRNAGFELVGSETGARWGRESLTYQRYELELG